MIKISVIIPVYNVEKYLNKCVESVINQNYKNLEIILVDDGSPDNCPAICDELALKDDRVKVIHKVNGGVSSARNAGIDNATGDYITFIDSDDYIDNNFSAVCEMLNDKHMEFVIVPMLSQIKVPQSEIMLNDDNFYVLIKNNNLGIASSCSKFYKKELLLNNRFIEGISVAEDKEFVIRLLTKCNKVNIINQPFYTYYTNSESVINSINYRLIQKFFSATDKIIEHVKKYNVSTSTKQNILEVFSSNLYAVIRYYPKCSKQEKKMVRKELKSRLEFLSLTKERGKKITYMCMRFLGIKITLNILNLLRKLKLIK